MAITVDVANVTIGEAASATAITINVPAGVANGDLLVLSIGVGGGNLATTTLPGWTFVASIFPGSNVAAGTWYRVASSEPASYTFSGLLASANRVTAEMVKLSGVNPTTVLDVAAATVTSNGVNPATVTTVTAGAVVLYAVAIDSATTTDIGLASGTTLIKDSTGTGKRLLTAYETQATAGTTTARTFPENGTTGLSGGAITMAFRPAYAFANTAEGGTNGAAVTAAGTGGASGDAFSSVTVDGTSSTLTYSSASAAHGSLSYAAVVPTSGHASLTRSGLSTAARFRVRLYVNPGSYPSATVQFVQVIAGATITYLYLNSAGKLMVQDAAGATNHTFTNSIPLNTWTRVEFLVVPGTTSTNGTLQAAFYPGDSLTATESYTTTTANAGTNTTFTGFAVGKINSAGSWSSFYIDDIAADDASSSTFIGPPPAALPATESWTGTDGAAWPAQWTTTVTSGASASIQGNRGQQSVTAVSGYQTAVDTLSGVGAITDTDVTVTFYPNTTPSEQYVFIRLRGSGTAGQAWQPLNGYQLWSTWNGSAATYQIRKYVGGTETSLGTGNAGVNWSASGVTCRFQAVGTTIRYKVWAPGSSEPATWTESFTDTSTASGSVSLLYTGPSAVTAGSVQWDNLTVTDGTGSADTTAPTVPTGVTATADSSSQITVAWTASTDAVGVASYRVRQGGVDVAGGTAVTGTSFAVTGLSPSTLYSFTVSAVDAAGNRSAESAAATATTPAAPDTTAPTVPTGVTATANSSTQVTVAWTASTDAVGVASYRVRQGGVDVTGHTADAASPAVITGLSPSTSYSFTVSAVDAAGNRSAESTAATVTTPAAADTTAPTVPTGVTATANSSNQVTIAWTASTDAVGVASYRIRRGGVDLSGATAVTGTSFADTSVAASTSYSYTVSAVDAAGNRSAESTAATVTTPPPTIPPAPTPTPIPPPPVVARALAVSVYQGNYSRVGQVPNYISCTVTWNYLGVGSGELVVGEDDPIAANLLMADQVVVAVVVDLGSVRWSGRVSQVSLEREGPAGSGVITATLVDEWVWLQRMLASQNGSSSSLASMPQYDTRTGPAASVAADYINAAASRLGVPVGATKPAADSSPSITLKARMTPLADLLTDPLTNAGVTMTGQIWLPGDPQPPDTATTLTTPTVVFRPVVLADKPWLQWSDAMTRITRLTFQGNQPIAYRVIVGLGGTDAARVYDQVINTTRQTGIGSFGLPEIYTDASDATLGSQSAAAGVLALLGTGGTVSASFELNDGTPFRFGDDYVVGDMASVVVNGVTWRQRITKVTAHDERSTGLVITPVVGDQSDLAGDDMMVQALARVAESVRSLQAGR